MLRIFVPRSEILFFEFAIESEETCYRTQSILNFRIIFDLKRRSFGNSC